MKNISRIKKNSIVALVMALTLVFSSVPVYATESTTASASSSVTSNSESKTTEEDKEETENEKESAIEKSTEDSEEKDYTFSTATVGNSELVANQEVLLENGYHQFIAVETRDGDIFYIIIDKTKTEDNVYFLNEVDTYDINKLMSDDDSESVANSSSASTSEQTTEATEATTSTSQTNASSSSSQFMLIFIVGILLGGIGFAIFKLKKGKKKPEVEDDFFDEDDDDEINEDKEGTV